MADIQKSIKFLESQDTRTFEDAKSALRIQIGLGNGIRQLVQYYAEQRSERALELLCSVCDPHDKVLLDALTDCFGRRTLSTIILLGQILQTAPSWVPKIASHPLFFHILKHIVKPRQEREMVDDIAVLLFLSNLLPSCSALPENTLNKLFLTFITACEILRQKIREQSKGTMDEVNSVHVSHLHYAVREYLITLYGIYPNNFVHYLRGYYWDMEESKTTIYRTVVKPLMAGVRFHPGLLEMNTQHELSKDRWKDRDPHDFFDDCRKIVVGIIPISTHITEEPMSEQDASSTLPSEVYRRLFPSKSSDTSSGMAWNDELAEDKPLMAEIDTPPGTRCNTPMHKRSLDESAIVVLDGKRRRSTGGGSTERRMSIRQKVSSLFRGKGPEQPPLMEVDSMRNYIEQGVDAMNAISPLEEPPSPTIDTMASPVQEISLEEHAMEVAREVERGRKQREEAEAAREAARRAVREERTNTIKGEGQPEKAQLSPTQDAEDLQPVPRSRSTSFLCSKPDANMKVIVPGEHTEQHIEEVEEQTSSEVLPSEMAPADRFSITSFFNKLNRQRFRSECPPNDEEKSSRPIQDVSPQGTRTTNTLKRTRSCPTVTDEKAGANIRTPAEQAQPKKGSYTSNLIEHFPYLAIITEPSNQYYDKLEAELEREHEVQRERYMQTSMQFHATLKEMNLADRLPGRIYDDMANILQGQSVEKQREILRCRLMLVNQHLLYERTCRLLHANRNRRLFARIKLQKRAEIELRNYREQALETQEHQKHLVLGLSELRKKLVQEGAMARAREAQVQEMFERKEKELISMNMQVEELKLQLRDGEKEQLRNELDKLKRKADDAEERMRIMEEKLRSAERDREELTRAHAENQSLRDTIALLEKSRQEEQNQTRNENDEQTIRILEEELERTRQLRANERVEMEELKRKKEDAEQAFKAEGAKYILQRTKLDHAAKLLREQNEAAEQKFLSLQAVTQRQEEHIIDLCRHFEELQDFIRQKGIVDEPTSIAIPSSRIPFEIRSYESSHGSEIPHPFAFVDYSMDDSAPQFSL